MNLTEAIEELQDLHLGRELSAERNAAAYGEDCDEAHAARRHMEALDLAIAVLSEQATVAPARKTDPATSHRAAPEEIKAGSAREKILRAAYNNWAVGGPAQSARELALAADLGHQRAPWKRVSELAKAGFLEAVWTKFDPDSKREVTVYETTVKGRAAVRGILDR